jgi:hypothetical protein
MRRNLSRFQDGKITQQGLTTRRLSLSRISHTRVKQHDRDPMALVITLTRSQKKPSAADAEKAISVSTTARRAWRGTFLPAIGVCFLSMNYVVWTARSAA